MKLPRDQYNLIEEHFNKKWLVFKEAAINLFKTETARLVNDISREVGVAYKINDEHSYYNFRVEEWNKVRVDLSIRVSLANIRDRYHEKFVVEKRPPGLVKTFGEIRKNLISLARSTLGADVVYKGFGLTGEDFMVRIRGDSTDIRATIGGTIRINTSSKAFGDTLSKILGEKDKTSYAVSNHASNTQNHHVGGSFAVEGAHDSNVAKKLNEPKIITRLKAKASPGADIKVKMGPNLINAASGKFYRGIPYERVGENTWKKIADVRVTP